jgi:hypothetical protein
MDEFMQRLEAGHFEGPFKPAFDNPIDPPGAEFIVIKHGIPWELITHPDERQTRPLLPPVQELTSISTATLKAQNPNHARSLPMRNLSNVITSTYELSWAP